MDNLSLLLRFPSSRQRYAGYDRIMGNVFWLLIALVTLDIKLMPEDDISSYFLGGLCILLFAYNINARYGLFSRRYGAFKTFVDLMALFAFVVAVCWFTGKITSPFISLMYLILVAASLTQGKRATYFMAGLAMISYVFMASKEFIGLNSILANVLELFPFMLIAHMGAMLAGETENARREMERMSLTDEITGVNNMRNFFLLAEVQQEIALRYKRPFTICMLDADNLKKINDMHGHMAGTEIIRWMATIITSNIRKSDVCARYGGDEYVILFNESSKRDVIHVVERIIAGMSANPFEFQGHKLSTTISAGIAGFPEDGADIRTVMANADAAMYISKQSGKNRVTVFSSTKDERPIGQPRREIDGGTALAHLRTS